MIENMSLVILALVIAVALWRVGINLVMLALAAFAVWYYLHG